MSNLEKDPEELVCVVDPTTSGVEVLEPREVPLGGPRALLVRRTLPQRKRSLIGAWCFVDSYGPTPTPRAGTMDTPPHPHTGLQTVSWLYEGEIEHRDSTGAHQLIAPGQVNLMTAGGGIQHSEVSTTAARRPARRAAVDRAAGCRTRRRAVLRAPCRGAVRAGRRDAAGVRRIVARHHLARHRLHAARRRRSSTCRPAHPSCFPPTRVSSTAWWSTTSPPGCRASTCRRTTWG